MKILISSLLLVACFVAFLLVSDYVFEGQTPTDEELIAIFEENRDSFRDLEKQFDREPALLFVSRSGIHRTALGGKVTVSEPSKEIVAVFDSTGIIHGARDGVIDVPYVSFPTFRRMISDDDESLEYLVEQKGFALVLRPVDDLDTLPGVKTVYGNVTFTRLEGPWYIFLGINTGKPE